MGEADVDEAVARFEGRGVERVELHRVAMTALGAARASLSEADFDGYAIVHVVSALKRRVREAGWNPPLPPELVAAAEAKPLPDRPSAVLRVECFPEPPS